MIHAREKAVTFQILGMINYHHIYDKRQFLFKKIAVQNSDWSKDVEIIGFVTFP